MKAKSVKSDVPELSKLFPIGAAKPQKVKPLLDQAYAEAERQKKADGLDIPASLIVKNRKPLTPEQQARVDAAKAKAQEQVKPKLPMSKAVAAVERKERKAETKAVKKPARDGMITVASIAKEYSLLPREARGLLRASELPKPAVGWAYDAKDPALEKVREVLKAGKKTASAKPVAVTRARKAAAVPPPSETVWSGKAKKAKVSPPKPVDAKADATKEVKKLVRSAKDVEVTKLPAGEKTPKAKIVKK